MLHNDPPPVRLLRAEVVFVVHVERTSYQSVLLLAGHVAHPVEKCLLVALGEGVPDGLEPAFDHAPERATVHLVVEEV